MHRAGRSSTITPPRLRRHGEAEPSRPGERSWNRTPSIPCSLRENGGQMPSLPWRYGRVGAELSISTRSPNASVARVSYSMSDASRHRWACRSVPPSSRLQRLWTPSMRGSRATKNGRSCGAPTSTGRRHGAITCDHDAPDAPRTGRVERRRDSVASRARWQFAERLERVISPERGET